MTEDLFPSRAVDRRQVLEELKRELAMRRRVYPRWAADRANGLTPELAQHRTECIVAAIDLLCEPPPLMAVTPSREGSIVEQRFVDPTPQAELSRRQELAQAEFDRAARSGMMTLESWRLTAQRMSDALAGRPLSIATAGPVDTELEREPADAQQRAEGRTED